jgi:hypothetical protein
MDEEPSHRVDDFIQSLRDVAAPYLKNRFGGVWTSPYNAWPQFTLGVVRLHQEDVAYIRKKLEGRASLLQFVVCLYSEGELLDLQDQITQLVFRVASETVFGIQSAFHLNRVVLELRDFDVELMSDLEVLVPKEALEVRIVPPIQGRAV